VAGAIMRRDTQQDSEAFDLISRKIKQLEEYRPLKYPVSLALVLQQMGQAVTRTTFRETG
jgi:hypothetical protein